MQNNVLEIFLAILPVFLYIYMVFKVIPPKMVSKRRAKKYLVAGMLTPTLVLIVRYMLPGAFGTSPDVVLTTKQIIYDTFIEAGFLEETIKFLAIWWVFSQRRNSLSDLPIATIFYAILVSAGFALVENLFYLIHIGKEVLLTRACTAIVMHMIVGVFLGYFVYKAMYVKKVFIEKYSQFEKYKMQAHRIFLILSGIFVSMSFHGLYNLNFSLPINFYNRGYGFVILAFGLIIAKFMIDEGVRVSKELRSKNYNKDHYENFR